MITSQFYGHNSIRMASLFQVSSGKNLRTAEEGHKRATRAMNVAGDWIVQMEDSLQQVRH